MRGAGLVFHSAGGCWGQIVFARASRDGPFLRMELTAGTCSPYLLRVYNKLDPAKPPSSNFVAAHTRVVWAVPVVFSRSGPPVPIPLDLGAETFNHQACELTLETAPAWLDHALAQLVPATQALCSNAAIHEWLIAPREWESTLSIQYALLLGRHLGLRDELPELERRAEKLAQRDHGKRDDRATRAADRQTTYPQDWSHARFMRFLESAPP
jgi:hypothetical protein